MQEKLEGLFELQTGTTNTPYSIRHRLALAHAYESLGYPDLAAGDAYKALLLVDECAEEGEFHEEALGAALSDYQTQLSSSEDDTDKVVLWAKSAWLKSAYVSTGLLLERQRVLICVRYQVLIPCLIQCGCLRSAAGFIQRASRAFPDEEVLASYRETLGSALQSHPAFVGSDTDSIKIEDYPDKGSVRRELYPWNHHEPDRFSPEALQLLNGEMTIIAPKLEVRVAELPVLR